MRESAESSAPNGPGGGEQTLEWWARPGSNRLSCADGKVADYAPFADERHSQQCPESSLSKRLKSECLQGQADRGRTLPHGACQITRSFASRSTIRGSFSSPTSDISMRG